MTDSLLSAMIYLTLGVVYLMAGGLGLLAMSWQARKPVPVVAHRREQR